MTKERKELDKLIDDYFMNKLKGRLVDIILEWHHNKIKKLNKCKHKFELTGVTGHNSTAYKCKKCGELDWR